MSYRFAISHTADSGYRQYLQALLRAHNHTVSTVDGPDAQPLTIRVMDEQGVLLGGLVGLTYWGWLVIDVITLEPHARGWGLGTQLLLQEETAAQARGCTRAHTSTYAFQALAFYQRHGYRVIGQLDDYPDGYTFYWLRRVSRAAWRRAPALRRGGDAPAADRAERDTEHRRPSDCGAAPQDLAIWES
jgi:GNAT superfamily N-acetyltransferase